MFFLKYLLVTKQNKDKERWTWDEREKKEKSERILQRHTHKPSLGARTKTSTDRCQSPTKIIIEGEEKKRKRLINS